MKNVITFRLWTKNIDNLLKVLKYLFAQGEYFIPKECEFGTLSNDDYIPFNMELLDTSIKDAINSDEVLILQFLTEDKNRYFHFTVKKGSSYFIKFDIINSGKPDFIEILVEFYEFISGQLDAIFGFAHDFEDAKNTFASITVNDIKKIYWINVFGSELLSMINNYDELNSLSLFSMKKIIPEGKASEIAILRLCESPLDILSSRFPILAEDFASILAKNKKIKVDIPVHETRNLNRPIV